MIVHIRHRTGYTYSERVFLEPHILRLVPRSDAMQHCHSFSLEVTPSPSGQTRILDVDGHSAIEMWFDRLTDVFTVQTDAVVETLCTNPYHFLLTVSEELPFSYPNALELALTPYLRREGIHHDVTLFAKSLAEDCNHEIIPFLTSLAAWSYRNIRHAVRDTGEPHPAHKTLHLRTGSCRDVAMLFIDACRSLGLAARFVSGYTLSPSGAAEERQYLHAWAEVYLPGAGWRGFDPSRGLAVADEHVAIATGCVPILAAPLSGSFRGNHVQAELSFDIDIMIHTSFNSVLQIQRQIS